MLNRGKKEIRKYPLGATLHAKNERYTSSFRNRFCKATPLPQITVVSLFLQLAKLLPQEVSKDPSPIRGILMATIKMST